MDDPLIRHRPEFPILDRCTYLVSHSLGAMPRGAGEGLARYAREWEERGVRAWSEGWWELPIQLGDRVGRLLGAPAGSVAMQPNVTLATAIFLSCLDFDGGRRRLVTDALNFPSLLYLFRQWGALGTGVEPVVVPSRDGRSIDPETLLAAIDERTRVVAISHVLFRSSFVQDVPRIVARAHEAGALVLLDVYQSAGILPIDLTALDVDGAVGGCLKWLCGGPGVAFLYVRPDRARELEPRLTGWQAHADPFAFAPELERTEGAARFLHGTPAIPALRAAEAGLDRVEEAGIEAIRNKSLRQAGRIIDRANEEGWAIGSPRDPERRGGVVSIQPPHAYEVSRALLARDIVIDYRPEGGIRIGPHFYNTDAEIDAALDAIAEILRTEDWRAFEGKPRDQVT
ncbi:MAG: aminotransferase class V-fold PLP-dependent enzyme [Candidatus Eisenbacteria bacterium]|nr:aminotransferase class V-fold PLP-dependent enzyme [Candidatus Latescibacterota bacterium]MBD3301440.1 aminotransferase class V-fold PLP-dependent enzyme [Candidatus Eisenbacteria bacterium]